MDSFNINVEPQTHNITITKGEPINITVTEEKVVLNKVIETNDINYEGKVIKIDANYPQAIEAARIATEKAEEAKEVVEGFDAHAASKITEYDSNASDKIATYNANAVEKTNTFNSNATSKTTAFNSNASSKTTAFNENATSKTTDFNSNASSKTSDFNSNATSKTNTFNQNATDKTNAFDSNASSKTSDFNDNYTAKKAIIDAEVATAQGAAETATTKAGQASTYADHAEIWAEGTDEEVEALGGVHSSKGWAEQSAQGQVQSNWAETDTSAKSYIQNKPNLATVATSGNYNDLSNKPTIPVVNNATLTIQKNGTTVKTFTANASTDVTANITVPTKTSDITNDSGYITGITSSDVTTALGYTPYDASNPSGYQANVIETVKVNGTALTPSNKAVDISVPTVTSTYSATGTDAVNGTAVASAISGKANTNLSNLTSEGQNIANWSSNVTNCITEIPQDIKLELNNGVLTIKAGSKVYVPNGSGVFNTTTVFQDCDWKLNSLNVVVFYGNGEQDVLLRDFCFSGSSAPTSFQSGLYALWYDTTNNVVKKTNNGGATWISGYGLPVYTANVDNSYQVFNGFGYIGSTVFALPGVKGLIPNGRNADGTLKNTEFETSSIITRTWTTQSAEGILTLNVIDNHPYLSIRPNLSYDEKTNKFVNESSPNEADVGLAKLASGKITSFTPKPPFHALDYNDSSTIAGWSAPSSRYIDLTLGASGTRYTAPANGWMMFMKAATNSNQWIYMGENPSTLEACGIAGDSGWCRIFFPVKKGDTFIIAYTAGGNETYNRFIYAEGDN